MTKEPCMIKEAVVTEVLPDNKYRVELQSGKIILAYASGLLCRRYVKIMVGDHVKIEVPIYSIELVRIVQRYRIVK